LFAIQINPYPAILLRDLPAGQANPNNHGPVRGLIYADPSTPEGVESNYVKNILHYNLQKVHSTTLLILH
jgi:hypothetical protein